VIADLREADAEQTVVMPYNWRVELGDLYEFAANGVHYDTAQRLAVLSYRHSITDKGCRTTLVCRGKPAGGRMRWLELEARGGVGGENRFYTHAGATGMVATASVASIIVVYDDPRGMSPPIPDWELTECHVSTVNDFVPDNTTLRASGKTTRFEIIGLEPGVLYYAKLRIIDAAGNVALTSTQVFVATQRVAAYHQANTARLGSGIPNADFGDATRDITVYPPDGWSAILGATYGAAGDAYYSTLSQTGYRSMIARAGIDRQVAVTSAYTPVRAGELVGVRAVYRVDSGVVPGAAAYFGVRVTIHEADETLVSTTSQAVLQAAPVADQWHEIKSDAPLKVHADGRLASAGWVAVAAGGEQGAQVHFDLVEMFRYPFGSHARPVAGAGQAVVNGVWSVVILDQETYDHGDVFDTATYEFTAPEDAFYSISARVHAWNVASFTLDIEIQVNGATVLADTSDSAGTIRILSLTSSAEWLQAGDTVRLRAMPTGTNATVSAIPGTFLIVKQIMNT
jgi:hypothetical protein